MAAGNVLDFLAEGLIAEKTEDANFLAPEDILPEGPARKRDRAEAALPFVGDGKIEARDDPRWRALEQIEFSNTRRDLRNELDGVSTGTDNGNVLAVQVHAVIPGRGMKCRAGKAFGAVQLRIARDV